MMEPKRSLKRFFDNRLWLLISAMSLLALPGLARAVSDEYIPGAIELSTGVRIEGGIRLARGPLTLYVAEKGHHLGKKYKIFFDEIKRLDHIAEQSEMADKWVFKEDGRDEKIKSGDKFPVIYFKTRVVFQDGRTLEGHIISATVYVKDEDTRKRYLLQRKYEGSIKEKLEDVVYVRSIELQGKPGGGVFGSISGKLTNNTGMPITALWAINQDRGYSLKGEIARDGKSYRVNGATIGEYTLVAVTDKAIFLRFSIGDRPGNQRFDKAGLEDLYAWLKKLREFFHLQKPIYAAGSTKRVLVLILNERYGKMSYGNQLLRRYDIFCMRKMDDWLIEKEQRIFLCRQMYKDHKTPARTIFIDPRMGGIDVNAKITTPKRDIVLRLPKDAPRGAVVDVK